MPQEFEVVRCFSCNIFQVQQRKKKPKWVCKMCGEKQSLKKVYGKGSGADCRKLVQSMNMTCGKLDAEAEDKIYNSETEVQGGEWNKDFDLVHYDEPCSEPSQTFQEISKWSEFLTETDEPQLGEEPESRHGSGFVVMERPERGRRPYRGGKFQYKGRFSNRENECLDDQASGSTSVFTKKPSWRQNAGFCDEPMFEDNSKLRDRSPRRQDNFLGNPRTNPFCSNGQRRQQTSDFRQHSKISGCDSNFYGVIDGTNFHQSTGTKETTICSDSSRRRNNLTKPLTYSSSMREIHTASYSNGFDDTEFFTESATSPLEVGESAHKSFHALIPAKLDHCAERLDMVNKTLSHSKNLHFYKGQSLDQKKSDLASSNSKWACFLNEEDTNSEDED